MILNNQVINLDKRFQMKQMSFLGIVQTRKLRCERFLDEMNQIIPWDALMGLIEPYYKENQVGRKRKELMMMLKIYCLQQWYALSDPGAEEAIYDRNSFQKFLEIDLMQDSVPDETTILNFRHLLEEHSIQKKIFKAVGELLEEKRLIMKRGTIVDATILEAPSSTKNKEKKRDSEMSSTKKGNTWHFGMKAHIGVDSDSGLVHSFETTTARIHDKEVEELLYHGEEEARYGDKGYYDEKKRKEITAKGIYWGIADRGKRNHPLSKKQKKRNKKNSSIRSKVEFPFQVIKCQWRYTKVRYRGLFKNTCNLFMLFSLSNLYKVRRLLIMDVN